MRHLRDDAHVLSFFSSYVAGLESGSKLQLPNVMRSSITSRTRPRLLAMQAALLPWLYGAPRFAASPPEYTHQPHGPQNAAHEIVHSSRPLIRLTRRRTCRRHSGDCLVMRSRRSPPAVLAAAESIAPYQRRVSCTPAHNAEIVACSNIRHHWVRPSASVEQNYRVQVCNNSRLRRLWLHAGHHSLCVHFLQSHHVGDGTKAVDLATSQRVTHSAGTCGSAAESGTAGGNHHHCR